MRLATVNMGAPRWLPEPYRRLPVKVYALFAANAVQSLGSFLWPMLALILSDRFRLDEGRVGLFVTLTMVAALPGALVGGKLADHLGHLEVLVVFRALAAAVIGICLPLLASRESIELIPWLLVAASLLRGAAEPSLMALVADITSADQRQPAFSLVYLAGRVGFLGPFIAGLLLPDHLGWIFAGSALASLLSVLIILVPAPSRGFHPSCDAPPPHARPKTRDSRSLVAVLVKRPSLLLLAGVLSLYSFVHVQHLFGLPLQVKEWYRTGSAGLYGTLLSLNSLAAVGLTPVVTLMSVRFRSATDLALGGMLYAAGFGMIGISPEAYWLFLSTVIWTLGEILVVTNSSVYTFEQAPASHRARISSVIPLLSQAGYAAGPWLTGLFIKTAGIGAVWPAAFLLAASSSVVMLLLGRATGGRRG